ncbi:hypothetical protein AVEN_93101-1 [Araneus ventricosus]|uniref:Uncharacterized protein n=1 Tax=Araneus ventricosus TaxID=182803 RepID=A0A4Y2IZ98_ARAVE|nr:hypothetical protein AVEN_93101-1 [Araneus ventricosus]
MLQNTGYNSAPGYWGYGMTLRILPFVTQTSYFKQLMTSVHCCPFQIEVFTCCSQCRLHIKKVFFFLELERLCKLLAEVETDEDSDFDDGPGDVLEENFSDHENFREHDTELEEDRRHCFSTYQGLHQ